MGEKRAASWIVLLCAVLWGFWWVPVTLMERAGLSGPWIALALNGVVLPFAVGIFGLSALKMSTRAVTGAVLIGLAVTLYAMAASYTDFLRAVLLFYLAPAWSTLIEVIWFRRRWTRWITLALSLSFVGVMLITRGEVSMDGLGATGDWMALASGLAWSAGVAMLFSAKRASTGGAFAIAMVGGVAAALVIAGIDGSLTAPLPKVDWIAFLQAAGLTEVFLGILLGGTLWGAFRLPPAAMTYLLSVEIVGGVFSAAVFLGERFGWFEAAGTICILGAVAVEVISQRNVPPGGGAPKAA